MDIILLSDQAPISATIREILLREGQNLPAHAILSTESARLADVLGRMQPDLILLVLASHAESALDLLPRLRRQTRSSILVIGDTNDPGLILRSIRAGASDFLDKGNLVHDLPAALARLATSPGITGSGETGQLIALLAPNGGAGCSTLAVNLAVALTRLTPRPVNPPLLIDMKMPLGDLAPLLDLKPAHTLAELCANASQMDRSMVERTLVSHASGVRLLAAPATFADCAQVTADGIREVLDLTRHLFSHVVVDLDNSFTPEQVEVLLASDVILVVFPLHFTCLRNARLILDYLEQLGIACASRPHKPRPHEASVRLVVNRHGNPREVSASKAEEALRMKISHFIPDDPSTVNSANNNGVPVVLESPRTRVARSLTELASHLARRPG